MPVDNLKNTRNFNVNFLSLQAKKGIEKENASEALYVKQAITPTCFQRCQDICYKPESRQFTWLY